MANFYPADLPVHRLADLPAGVAGIRATLDHMVRLTKQGRKDLGVRTVAMELVRELPQKAFADQVVNLFQFVQKRIRYVSDVRDVETLQAPKYTLEKGQGDCDDKSTLLAALLESIGHPTRFAALAIQGGPFSHVIVETRLGAKWKPLDATVSYAYVGWLPPGITSFIRAHV